MTATSCRVSLSLTIRLRIHIHLWVTPKPCSHPWLSCVCDTGFSIFLQVTFTCMESLKVYSQCCVTVSLAYDRSHSSLPSLIFFYFQQLEAFPLWACDLPISSNSCGSHNHSPQLLQVSKRVQSTCCLPPRALQEFHLVAAEQRLATWEGLWACSEQWKHSIWLSPPRAKTDSRRTASQIPKDKDPKDARRTKALRWPLPWSVVQVGKWSAGCDNTGSCHRHSDHFKNRTGASGTRSLWPLAQLALRYCQERKMHKRYRQIYDS